jgi:hypothetical protein
MDISVCWGELGVGCDEGWGRFGVVARWGLGKGSLQDPILWEIGDWFDRLFEYFARLVYVEQSAGVFCPSLLR